MKNIEQTLYRDFVSDLNLAYEIATRPDINEDPVILIIAIGAVFFIALPYTANLVIAARIKKIIKQNEAAKSWLSQPSEYFLGISLFLSLFSSNK